MTQMSKGTGVLRENRSSGADLKRARSRETGVSRTIMNKIPEDAYTFIEELAINSHQWHYDRVPTKSVGVHSIDAIASLSAHINALTRKVECLNVSNVQVPVVTCELCGGPHISTEC